MVSLTPCRRCHRRADCSKRAATLAALKGTGITKANLKCGIPAEDFPVGGRVSVQAFRLTYGSYGSDDWARAETWRTGTVAIWRRQKATVILDRDQEIEHPSHEVDHRIAILHVEPDRMQRIEGTAEMCQCGMLTKARCDAAEFPMLRGGGDWYCEARPNDPVFD